MTTVGFTSRACAVAVFMFATGLVHAGPVVYAVNSNLVVPGGIGINDGTWSGTIETDGTIGTLSASNILSWSLLLNDGIGQTFTINSGNSALTLTGTATTATSSLLQFNYDSPDFGGLGYFEILDAADGWGLFFSGPGSPSNGGIINPDGASTVGILGLGPQPKTIGVATPEPSAFLLIGSALGILGLMRSRTKLPG